MRSLLIAAVLLPLVGCSARSAPDAGPVDPADRMDPMLTARILPPTPLTGLRFATNRPAHVAVFEIVPGVGTSLVYPFLGSGSYDRVSHAGLHAVPMRRVVGRELYRPVFASQNLAQPRFYFLIASEEPLELDRLGPFGLALRSAMGTDFAALNAYDTMDRLTAMAIPNAYGVGDWTTDFYVHWPEVLSNRPIPRYVRVSCNGHTTYVHPEHFGQAYRMLCNLEKRKPEAVQPPERGDSTRVEVPSRERPEPEILTVPRRALVEKRAMEDRERRKGHPAVRETPPITRERPRIEVPDRPNVEPRSAPEAREPVRVEPRSRPAPAPRPRSPAPREPRTRGGDDGTRP